jgi:hypothetical protein
MLHRINFPKCQRDLIELLSFQRKFLQFSLSVTLPLTLNKLKVEFGDVIGTWLWERINHNRKYTVFGKQLKVVANYARTHRADTASVMTVFSNDIDFASKSADLSFRFLYATLSPEWQGVLKPFLISFYDRLSQERGFPQNIFGWPAEDLTRANLMRDYRDCANGVCPYCDAAEGDSAGPLDANDADHLLPKDTYPCLSVHWANLIRACMQCNERFKLANDPLLPRGVGEFQTTYHPFYAQAIENGATVKVQPSTHNPNEYDLQLQDSANPNRASNIDRILKLNERWTGRVNKKLQSDKSALVAFVISGLKEENIAIDKPLIERQLAKQAAGRRAKIGIMENMFLESAVIEYQSKAQDEIDAILAIHK